MEGEDGVAVIAIRPEKRIVCIDVFLLHRSSSSSASSIKRGRRRNITTRRWGRKKRWRENRLAERTLFLSFFAISGT